MGDSETIVAQASASDSVQYPSTGYASGGLFVQDVPTLERVSEVTASCASGRDTDVHVIMDDRVSNDENTRENDSNPAEVEDVSEAKFEKKDSTGIVANSERDASVDNGVLDMPRAASYDGLNANVNETSYYSSLGNATEISGVSSAEQQLDDNAALSPEEDRLWSIVRANSLDFSAWTSLIEETEKMAEDNILRIRRVYDAFLSEFPLCYGYWKKYADHEARIGSIDKVIEVYERAVQGVTYSVDIWLHYCIFTINTYGDPETIRRLFERGLAYVGTDYLSYPLWDKFIEYEYSQQEWSRLALIYTQIIEHPNQQLDRYFNSFKELASSRPLSDLRTAEEGASMGPVTQGDVNERDAVQQSSEPVSDGLTEPAEELEKYVAIREEMYKKAKEFDSKIIGFETAIRRPYFHVRPLNVIELENWHNYLDFMEREGDFNKVVKLYERCLIACANYPEYWIRYALCMEASGSMDLANNALARATQVFVKRQPDIHLFAAHLRELHGDVDGARAAYHLVHAEISPGLIEAIIKHANMERRLGKIEDALLIYEQAIAVEKGKEQSLALPMLLAQYSRFLYLVCGNAEKARDVLVEAVDNVQLSKPLLEALIHLESVLPHHPKRIDFLDSLVEKFVVGNPEGGSSFSNNADKEEISCIFLELVDLFGDSNSIKRAEDRHTRFFSHHRSTSELKKRHAEDYLASEKAKAAKSYSSGGMSSSPAQSLMGTYYPAAAAAAHHQWAYNVQAQAWPQAQAAQAGQAWMNPGYAQQVAAYGGSYTGGGGGYMQPQVPSSSAQQTSSAAYLTCPPAYPAHAYPPQPYAAAPVPVQQPVQHQQTYYAGYY